ncbi:GRB2-associated-binding protein 1-like isoform X2 [Poeciliopsis prolifica]|uniref:GRB2-associated-binding protein 1-like isoform X2 n=1 Tax=Poeciliopsis prolifica TaxID=188132 RepID=UPI002413E3A4|nr:GRB2-associated-binding protein 1-like isoform X2 [Poeciliopsis prolifica]
MSGAGDVVCEGWLRKSPPEKKLRRYAWKRRWFVLRSGRLSGEPDVLQYYKNQHSRRPIGTINLNLCELVDAGLSFTKKELESSFVFDLRTEERTWYLVAESEEDMNRWVTSICLLCGFNPTDDAAERQLRSNSASTSVTATRGTPTTTMVSGSIPPPYDPVGVRHLEHDSSAEDDYLWLSNCQTHTRPALGSSTSLETDYSGNLYPPPSATYSSSSSCSSSSSLPPTSLPPPTLSGFRSAPWTMIAMASPLSQSLDATLTSDFQKRASRCHGHPSPHPRKHSLDFHLRPAATTLSDDNRSNAHPSSTTSGYQVPRPASTPQLPPPHRPSSTPSVDSLTQAELHAAIPPPPPRPPKPPAVTLPAEIAAVGTGPGALPRANSEPERRDEGISRGTLTKGSESVFIPRTQSDRATVFEFSESFNTYFFNKGMVPLGSLCSEDDDLDESYVPMSASTNEPPVAARANPGGPSDFTAELQDGNYVPMTPLTSSLPAYPVAAAGDLALLGRQVPPPAHMGFRNPTVTPVVSSTLPLRRNTMHNTSGGEAEVAPPPIHRNLKPQRKGVCGSQSVEKNSSQIPAETTHKTKVKPAPLEITPVSQDWQEVPPPVRSPVTRTFTRGPSIRGSFRPSSAQSSSPSSDSDDPDDSYVSMVTSSLSQSAGEQSLRMMVHRGSEGGVSSPLAQRAEKQKRSTAAGGPGSSHQAAAGDERARGDRRRVDYVVVDPKRTKALKNTREAWHDGRMSTEKEKS